MRRIANAWQPLASIPPGGSDAGAWTRLADVVATSSNRVAEVIDTAPLETNAQRYYRLATPRMP